MTSIKQCALTTPLVGAVLLSFACNRTPDSSPPAKVMDAPAGKRTAEELAKEWMYGPEKGQTPQSYGSESAKSGENLVVASARLRDPGKAKDWMTRISAFYTEKCGSDKDPVKLHAESGKHQVGINGESKGKGRYMIAEPGLMNTPIAQIPPRPQELVFAHHNDNATVTVVVWQQGDDVIFIAVTAAVR